MSNKLPIGLSNMITAINEKYDVDLLSLLDNPKQLLLVSEHYNNKKEVSKQLGESIFTHPNCAKSYLISEAARLLLREIAPKRIKKRKSKK